jgi:hypothetical protein
MPDSESTYQRDDAPPLSRSFFGSKLVAAFWGCALGLGHNFWRQLVQQTSSNGLTGLSMLGPSMTKADIAALSLPSKRHT